MHSAARRWARVVERVGEIEFAPRQRMVRRALFCLLMLGMVSGCENVPLEMDWSRDLESPLPDLDDLERRQRQAELSPPPEAGAAVELFRILDPEPRRPVQL